MLRFEAERNLQFGLLAFRTGLIDQTALVTASHSCRGPREKSLAEILTDHGALDAESAALIDALASKHLQAHGSDVEKSVASLAAAGPTREILAQLGDPALTASLARVTSDSTTGASDGESRPTGPR